MNVKNTLDEMEKSNQKHKTTLKPKDSKISKQTHIVEETSATGEKQFHCTACRKTFRSRSQKYYHLNCNQLQDLTYKCEYCDKGFARHSQWKYHTESHISPVNECPKCLKTFSNPLALKKHEGLHNVEPKICPHCAKTFQKKISLDQHIAAQHLNQLKFCCAYCDKKYASKSTLQLHMQSHEQKRFECSICGKLFQRNSILNLHLKRHYHANNYKCPMCDKIFSETGALARHRKIHEENALQYHCKICNKNILRKDNMTRHLNTIHPEEKFEEIVEIIRSSSSANVGLEKIENESNTNDVYNVKQTKNIVTPITHEKCVIIENKLIQKPITTNHTIVNNTSQISEKLLSNNVQFTISEVQETINDEISIGNQIQVITIVPGHEKLVISNDARSQKVENYETLEQDQSKEYTTLKNVSTNYNKQSICEQYKIAMISQIPKTEKNYPTHDVFEHHIEYDSELLFHKPNVISHLHPEDTPIKTEKLTNDNVCYNIPEIQDYFVLNDNNITNDVEKSFSCPTFINSNTKSTNSYSIQPVPKELKATKIVCSPPEQSKIQIAPKAQTVSSVIKSIGNVKKKLTSDIITSSSKIPSASIKPIKLEYKHKKYCRNNYDIDLYRKILGCDDDDYNNYSDNDDSHQELEQKGNQQQKSTKSSENALNASSATPVHWRKCFKNNYETSAS